MSTWNGFLFSKQYLFGSKSEGPVYYLQEFNYNETEINKNAELWQEDKKLQPFIGKKMTIEGIIKGRKIQYKAIKEYMNPGHEPEKKVLAIEIKAKSNTVGDCTIINITYSVRWPYRSIWEGKCPNGKKYEFILMDEEKQIAVWSNGRKFDDNEMEIKIPGGDPIIYNERIVIDNGIIINNNIKVVGVFIASGQHAECKIDHQKI